MRLAKRASIHDINIVCLQPLERAIGERIVSLRQHLRGRDTIRFKAMIDDIYNARILEFAGNIPRLGSLEDADASAMAHSKLCGSKVRVFLKVEDGKVSDSPMT